MQIERHMEGTAPYRIGAGGSSASTEATEALLILSRDFSSSLKNIEPSRRVQCLTATIVPAFGTRVKFRRYRLGLIDGAAKIVARRTPMFDSAKAALPAGVLNCPACGGVETANHVLLHCHRTQGVWDEAIVAATAGAKGTVVEGPWGALDRRRRAGNLLGSAGLVHGAPIAEVHVARALGLRAGATKSLVLGFARVDAQLKVDRAQIRALTKVAVKARRAFEKAANLKQAAQQGARCLPPRRDARSGSRSRPLNARRLRGGGRRAERRN